MRYKGDVVISAAWRANFLRFFPQIRQFPFKKRTKCVTFVTLSGFPLCGGPPRSG